MTYARAKSIDADAMPVIDLAPFTAGQNVKAVASSGPGFLYFGGHGMPSSVIDAARASAHSGASS